MKVYMDRTHCDVHQAACESCFGGRIELHFTGGPGLTTLDVAGCVTEIKEEDEKSEIIFFIHDRDGTEKILYVNQDNWPDAYNSWMELYDKQINEAV